MEMPNAYIKTPTDNLAFLFKKRKSKQYTVNKQKNKGIKPWQMNME